MLKQSYPLISVIVPVYNVEKYLIEAVDSVCKQSYKNLEIILVDDGSKDKSGDICNNLALQDSRIIVYHKDNGGLSSARNYGMDFANGEYIYFLDSDDFIQEETISKLFEGFLRNNNIGIVSSPCIYRYCKGKCSIFRKDWAIKEERIIKHNNFCLATLNQYSCHTAWNKLYKKEIIENTRFREGKKNEDTLFMFDLSSVLEEKKMDMLEIPFFSYYYRENEGSITMNTQKPFYIDIIDNLILLKNEASNKEIRNAVIGLYYRELVKFTMYLFFLENKQGEEYRKKYFQQYYNALYETNMKEVLCTTDITTTTKYFMMKYCKKGCRIYHKIKHIYK